MPTGTGVVDAFKSTLFSLSLSCLPLTCLQDLIRHGKNHHSARQPDNPVYYNQPPAQQQQPQPQPQHQTKHTREPEKQPQQQQKAQQDPKIKDHVEQIVQEEREAKGKLPTYKGLENYRLLEKMGE